MEIDYQHMYSHDDLSNLLWMMAGTFLFTGLVYQVYRYFEDNEEETYYSLVYRSKTRTNDTLNLFSNGKRNVVLFGDLGDFLHRNTYHVHNLNEMLIEKIAEFAVSKYIQEASNTTSHFMGCYVRPKETEDSDIDEEDLLDLTNPLKLLQGPTNDFLIGMKACWTPEMFVECLSTGIGFLNQTDIDLENSEIVLIDNNCEEHVWQNGQCISDVLDLKNA